MKQFLENEEQCQLFGKKLAKNSVAPMLIFFHGELGAGKTTIIRAFLRALDVKDVIKSPTYALVEQYQTVKGDVYHFDLYRLSDPEELEYIGMRDYLSQDAIVCIEWPEQGAGALPVADLSVDLKIKDHGREMSLVAGSTAGEYLLKQLIS